MYTKYSGTWRRLRNTWEIWSGRKKKKGNGNCFIDQSLKESTKAPNRKAVVKNCQVIGWLEDGVEVGQ